MSRVDHAIARHFWNLDYAYVAYEGQIFHDLCLDLLLLPNSWSYRAFCKHTRKPFAVAKMNNTIDAFERQQPVPNHSSIDHLYVF